MKNLFIITILYLLLSMSQAWSLPTCPGSPQTGEPPNWHNCFGIYTTPEGSRWIGEWKQGSPNGQVMLFHADGEKYVGQVKAGGVFDGQGIYSFPNGAKYMGEYKDNVFHGYGVYVYDTGSKYTGEWVNNLNHGFGVYSSFEGYTYIGEWRNDKYHGQGTFIFANGDKYIGEFKDGNYNGQGILTYADGNVWDGIWKNGAWISGEKYLSEEKTAAEISTKIEREKKANKDRRSLIKKIKEKTLIHKENLQKNIIKVENKNTVSAIPFSSYIEDYTIYDDNFWVYAKITSIDISINEVTGEKTTNTVTVESNGHTCDVYNGLPDPQFIKIGDDIAFKTGFDTAFLGMCGQWQGKTYLRFSKVEHEAPTDIERPRDITVDEYFLLNLRYADLVNVKITGIVVEPPSIYDTNSMAQSNVKIKKFQGPQTITCMVFGRMSNQDMYLATSKKMNTVKVGDKVTCVGSFVSRDFGTLYMESANLFHVSDIITYKR